MSKSTTQKALEFAKECERAGKFVKKIVVEGKKFELEFENKHKSLGGEIKW